MTMLQFLNDNSIVCLFALYIVCTLIFRSWNRLMRHLNIRAHGWPPPHLDADGEFKPKDEETNS